MVRCAVLTLALLLCAGFAFGQEEQAPAAPTKEEQALEQQWLAESVAAYREIQMILIVQALRLNSAQVEAVINYMTAIQESEALIAEESATMPRRDLTAVRNVLQAWMELGPIDPADRDAGLQALGANKKKTARAQKRIDSLIAEVTTTVLDAMQQEVLETREEVAAAMRQAGRRFGGRTADTAAIVQAIRSACLLDPQVFEEQLNDNAQAIAVSIVGAQSPVLGPLTDRVLNILVQLQPLTAQDWQAQETQIGPQIIMALGLDDQADDEDETTDMGDSGLEADVIAEEAFHAFLRDARALELLKGILATAVPEEAPQENGIDADPIPAPEGADQ